MDDDGSVRTIREAARGADLDIFEVGSRNDSIRFVGTGKTVSNDEIVGRRETKSNHLFELWARGR